MRSSRWGLSHMRLIRQTCFVCPGGQFAEFGTSFQLHHMCGTKFDVLTFGDLGYQKTSDARQTES